VGIARGRGRVVIVVAVRDHDQAHAGNALSRRGIAGRGRSAASPLAPSAPRRGPRARSTHYEQIKDNAAVVDDH
jgi:hypothetical protein